MAKSTKVYPEVESKTLEFKESLPNFLALIKTCVAFANTAGGQIMIGIRDGTREIIGATDEDRTRLYADFPNSLYDSTNNGLFVHIYERNMNDHSVLVIDVPLSAKRPVFIKKEGLPNGVYLRVGASTRRAKDAHIEELLRESKHKHYDTETDKARLEDLSKIRLGECYGKSYTPKKLLSDSVISPLHLDSHKYAATIAGILMFSDHPEHYIPEAIVICTEFSGRQGRQILQTRELNGPIPDLAHESLSVLEGWLQRNYQVHYGKLAGKTPIPVEALREAIINALIHRKYSVPGAVKIALYEDRLEVFSPGDFPGLVDINNLGDGTTYLRNPHLTALARRVQLVEKLGTGIKLIFDSCRAFGLRKPEYYEDGDFVKLVFHFLPSLHTAKEEDEVILDFMASKKDVTIKEISLLLNVSRNTATRKLSHLIKKGEIKRKGQGPSVRYYQ